MPYLIPHSKGKYIQFNSWIEYFFSDIQRQEMGEVQ